MYNFVYSLFSNVLLVFCSLFFFFFNDTATTEIYTLSLHDALPIFYQRQRGGRRSGGDGRRRRAADRKSTRLNSSHQKNSYAVFCLKKKKRVMNACRKAIQEEVCGVPKGSATGG